MKMRQLRLVRDLRFRDGAGNMAADCAILEAVAAKTQLPTLRLYGWDPFCLSIGYGQRVSDVDIPALAARGWQLVRRPTGGKAILHGDELTYSLCLPLDHPLAAGSVVDSYRAISRGLSFALLELGLLVRSEKQSISQSGRHAGPVCFEVSSHYEITVDGRKLVGSAQMRRKGGILQHGTIPLVGDVARICDVLRFDSEAAREQQRLQVRQRALTLADVMDSPPSWRDVAAAVVCGFQRALAMELHEDTLSSDELARMRELKRERFVNPEWTLKR